MHQCVCVDERISFPRTDDKNVLPTNGCLEFTILGAHAIKQWGQDIEATTYF